MISKWLVSLKLLSFLKLIQKLLKIKLKNKISDQFNEKIVLHQVKYLGLMENLRVRRAGFAYRKTYEQFLQRYKSLCSETWPNYHGPAKEGVQTLVCHLGYNNDEYRMGK